MYLCNCSLYLSENAFFGCHLTQYLLRYLQGSGGTFVRLTKQERQRRIKINRVLRSGAQCLLFSNVIWVGRRIEPNISGVLPTDTW